MTTARYARPGRPLARFDVRPYCWAILLVPLVAGSATAQDSATDGSNPPRPEIYKHAVFKPVGLLEVVVRDRLWKTRIDNSRQTGMLDYLEKFEKAGYIDNFRFVADNVAKPHTGGPNNNEFVYKLMEAAGYYAAELPDSHPDAARAFDDLDALVLRAQRKDGYLNTFYENPLNKERGLTRFAPGNRFEFYNFGHFTQAAIARYRTTGDDRLLRAAVKFADLIDRSFGPPKPLPYTRNRDNRPNLKYEHPNHETALVELYRATGQRRYLEFAKHTLDQYAFWDFEEIWGHAVQETLLLTGGTDVFLEYGEPAMMKSLERLWHDARHERKMYLTGSVGSTGYGESYGKAYQLPNETAYAETCAAISLVFWNYRMLLATGDSKYADCMERSLYNGVLSGVSLGGTEYFYRNPLAHDPEKHARSGRRSPFFGCSCCPPNVHRLLGSLQQYVYTRSDEGVQVHLYVTSELATTLASGVELKVAQRTGCPREGHVKMAVDPARPARFAVRLRVPKWTAGSGDAESLYRFQSQEDGPGRIPITLNGQEIRPAADKGYLVIDRTWQQGDVLAVDWPMPVLYVTAHEKVEADRGRMAIQRGPLVYCAEGIDNGGDVLHLELPDEADFQSQKRMLGIVRTLVGKAERVRAEAGSPATRTPTKITLIPYYAWANREPCQMQVWLKRVAPKKPPR